MHLRRGGAIALAQTFHKVLDCPWETRYLAYLTLLLTHGAAGTAQKFGPRDSKKLTTTPSR